MMTSDEIREKFLSYFESKGHTRVSSSSLVPQNDPTLLFTNAGMNQFKDVFLGVKKLPFSRATTSQKCVRAGGKHNDLESVGRTARHHTFFEMLGNFSFGDYFKKEAIAFSWEFLTEVLNLPKDKLWVSIYKNDDEAFELWREIAKIPADRIVRLGEKDNFWSMGNTGPCGPCSEIYIDRGEKYSCSSECQLGKCDCDRWRELWNLVFMQYDRDKNGKLTPLPRPSIDTGMGLERIATVMQGVYSNYDTDLLRPLIAFVENISGKNYFKDEKGLPFRVIADHARAMTFLISDGVLPGNEGRNYVLRRIIRRAVRYGRELDLNEPFMYKIVPKVVSLMSSAYPELKENLEYIQQVVKHEEVRFSETLNDGLKILYEGIDKLKKDGENEIPGEMAFTLYDTYGFPLDLTKDVADERGFTLDTKTFEELMLKQKEKAKASQKGTYKIDKVYKLLAPLAPTDFIGYDVLESECQIILLLDGYDLVESIDDTNKEFIVVLDKTPFYGESGGQVGDTGTIENENFKFIVTDTRKTQDGKFYHIGKLERGSITLKQKAYSKVNVKRRKNIARNHSVTHILHKALKEILGQHVNQAGSLVNEDKTRFDFTHFDALTPEQICQIENKVNDIILMNLPVEVKNTTLEKAKEDGAVALFGEKYGKDVRVVSIGNYSKELCGGTHVKCTSEIGLFKIVSESSIGSGLRRIEAVTGTGLLNYLNAVLNDLNNVACLLKTNPQEVNQKIKEMLERIRDYEKEIESLRQRNINDQIDDIIKNKIIVDGIPVISYKVNANDIDDLRNMSDVLRQRLKSSIIVLGSSSEDKVTLVAAVSKDLTNKGYHAGKIIKQVASIVGGGGGGRADFAQAGGKKPAKLNDALNAVPDIVSEFENKKRAIHR
jgi:alanyl-tRNA synthetase